MSRKDIAPLNDATLVQSGRFTFLTLIDCIRENGKQSFRGILWKSHILPSSGPLVSVLGYRRIGKTRVARAEKESVEQEEREQRKQRQGTSRARNIQPSRVYNAGSDEPPCVRVNFFLSLFPPRSILFLLRYLSSSTSAFCSVETALVKKKQDRDGYVA